MPEIILHPLHGLPTFLPIFTGHSTLTTNLEIDPISTNKGSLESPRSSGSRSMGVVQSAGCCGYLNNHLVSTSGRHSES
jgi:hypothetical protein